MQSSAKHVIMSGNHNVIKLNKIKNKRIQFWEGLGIWIKPIIALDSHSRRGGRWPHTPSREGGGVVVATHLGG